MTSTNDATIEDLIKTLKAIDRRARTAYKASKLVHDEDLAMIGMMAENAILKVEPEYNGKI